LTFCRASLKIHLRDGHGSLEEKMPKHLKIFMIALCFLMLVFAGFADAQKTLSVQVHEGQMRSTPSFLGTIVARLPYGERVVLIDDQGAWKKVSSKGVQGWMDASALTTKSIVLKAGANVQTSATGSEISLAGKGFSEEVEKQYKSQNKNIDFAWVDRMQRFKITPEEMQAFLKQGQVVPAAGGVK
jgi:uncharacterized protein YraI